MSWRVKFAILLLSFLSLVGMPQHQGEAQQQQPPRRGPFFQPPPPPNPPPSQIQQQQQQSQQQQSQPQQPGIRPEDILRLIPQFIPPDQFDESDQQGSSRSRAPAANLNLSGNWTSNLGKVKFRQAANQITGTLAFSNGVVATIVGTLQGNTLIFRWRIGDSPVHGTGKLIANTNGTKLTGTYKDLSQQTGGPFNLTRDAAPQRPPGRTTNRPAAPAIKRSTVQPVASDDEIANWHIADLRDRLHDALDQLDLDLRQLGKDKGWHDFLLVPHLMQMVQASANPASHAVARATRSDLKRWDQVAGDTAYARITDLPSFRLAHRLLLAFAADPLVIHGRELAMNVDVLRRELARTPEGQDWIKQLRIVELGKIAQLPPEKLATAREQFAGILDGYKSSKDSPVGERLKQISEFTPVLQSLIGIIEQFEATEIQLLTNKAVYLPGGADLYRLDTKGYTDHRDIEIDPNSADQEVIFHWNVERVDRAGGAVWQVSKVAFAPFSGDETDFAAHGLLLPGVGAGLEGSFPLDFRQLFAKAAASDTVIEKTSTVPTRDVVTIGGLPVRLATPTFPWVFLRSGGTVVLYVRAIPILSPDDPVVVGQPSNTIRVWYGRMPENAKKTFAFIAEANEQSRPTATFDADQIDPDTQQTTIGEPLLVDIYEFWYSPFNASPVNPSECKKYRGGGPSTLEQVNAVLKEGGEDLVGAWNWLVTQYREGKQAVVSITADGLNGILSAIDDDLTLGKELEDALNLALDSGLAALGIPPDLPNTDELIESGIDGLADAVLENSGFPQILNEAIEKSDLPAVAAGQVEQEKAKRLAEAKEAVKNGLRAGVAKMRQIQQAEKEKLQVANPCHLIKYPTTVKVRLYNASDQHLFNVQVFVVPNDVFDNSARTIGDLAPGQKAFVVLGLGPSHQDKYNQGGFLDQTAWSKAYQETAFSMSVSVTARTAGKQKPRQVGHYRSPSRVWTEPFYEKIYGTVRK